MRPCRVDYEAPGLAQRLAHLADRPADPGVGFDLGAQKLADHPVRPAVSLAHLEDAAIRVREQIARLGVDEKELFLDTEHDVEFGFAH